jgi:hypothetical protein
MKRDVVELWDVLCLSTWASLQLTLDVKYAWPAVILCACIVTRTRDMHEHEVIAALYMLRHSCGATRAATAWLSAPVVALGVFSRMKRYLDLEPMTRRACVLAAIVLCTVLLHDAADLPVVAVVRLVLYTATTRHGMLQDLDTWDCIAQSIWLLCVPMYVLVLAVLQINDACSIYPGKIMRRSYEVWTSDGVAHAEV